MKEYIYIFSSYKQFMKGSCTANANCFHGISPTGEFVSFPVNCDIDGSWAALSHLGPYPEGLNFMSYSCLYEKTSVPLI